MIDALSHKRLLVQAICLVRFILGLVFRYASIGKILDPKSFAEDLIVYRIFDSPQLLKYVAVTLPWIEWFFGIFLVLGVFLRSVSTLTTILLFTFLLGMSS